jgi:hypothetical protein
MLGPASGFSPFLVLFLSFSGMFFSCGYGVWGCERDRPSQSYLKISVLAVQDFQLRLLHFTCLTTHWSGWSGHADQWLIFLAIAQFEAVRPLSYR